MKNLAIITGPTASGKTAASIETAKLLGGEIISADSMQVYRYMDIGSAKSTKEEMQGVPHHMIDILDPHEEFSVAIFRRMAVQCIDEITQRDKLPIIVGGTGLYISSLTKSLDFTEISFDTEYRTMLTEIAETKGNEALHGMLAEVDPESYQRLFPNDVKRVIRALEVFRHTRKTISEYQQESKNKPIDYHLAYVGLTMERELLYDRINRRVDMMFDKGIVEEVALLRKMGYTRDMVAMQGIGYKEILDHFDGLASLEQTKDKIKQFSRNYAKRQLTWFRRDERIHWIKVDEYSSLEQMVENIVSYIEGKFKDL